MHNDIVQINKSIEMAIKYHEIEKVIIIKTPAENHPDLESTWDHMVII